MEARLYTVRYRDAFGFLQTLSVTTKERRAVDAARKQANLANKRWHERHVTFTDLGSTMDGAEELTSRPSQQGNPWEGPKYAFAYLIGEGRVWDGRDEDFCGGRRLAPTEYCLGCDRSGRDLVIPSATDRRTRNHRDSGFKGGCEGKK